MNVYFIIFVCIQCVVFGNDYMAVDNLDLDKYIGKWYQVYGDNFNKVFQGAGTCSQADYSFKENGEIAVVNQQINKQGNIESIEGIAYYKDGDSGGYLTVKLDNLTPAPYWVLSLGPVIDSEYQYSIVSDNNALSLFVLTRNVEEFEKKYKSEVLDSLTTLGFTKQWNHPIALNQTDCS